MTPLEEAAANAGIALPRQRHTAAPPPALPATLAVKLAHVFNLAEQEIRLTEAQQRVAAEEQEFERRRLEKREEIALKHLAARQRRDTSRSVVHARLQQRAQVRVLYCMTGWVPDTVCSSGSIAYKACSGTCLSGKRC
jgi:hypothetical protein